MFLKKRKNKYTPSDFVVPVVVMHDDGGCGPFLGSGVFVGTKSILVTCNHVLGTWKGQFGVEIETENRLAKASIIIRDSNKDLALLKVQDYQPPHSIPLEEDENIILNNLVICFEYGTTVIAGNR